MDALDVSTVDQWEYQWYKHTDYLVNKKNNIRIAIEKRYSLATIDNINSKIFSDVQVSQLYNKAIEMRYAIEKRKSESVLQDDVKTLKGLFPHCFK